MYEAFVRREQAERALWERNAYITGLLANTNLDDGKQTKRKMLENVDNDYQNSLRNIYNVIVGEDTSLKEDPFFKAMKIPGKDYIPGEEEATVPVPTTNSEDIDIDQQGG